MNVVIVESPAKAKTINKYLGGDYVVLASYGHVRDLPSKDGSVEPDNDFHMTYQVEPRSAKHLAEINRALDGSDRLILATDPDREGEAISWHILQALGERRDLSGIDVERVVFNAITKNAVLDAMAHPRELDMDLVNAQQARRALDYLVGFNLSPVLWRKLPGARSAGRVQSVALRLVCERENEIELFRPEEYWTIDVVFKTTEGAELSAKLTQLAGKRLDKFALPDEATAMAAVATIEAGTAWRVAQVETKPARRHPQPPFTTSTLQQEASRKLGFGASRTMQVAQRLYEGIDIGGETTGLITYMRTDGVQMADEAIHACRRVIGERFGDAFVPEKVRVYRTKAKNAQEAHEAIRPTDMSRDPSVLAGRLDADQLRLYDLIWKRSVASQMESARLQRTSVDIQPAEATAQLRATGSVIEFPGFLKLYEEGRDEKAGDDEDRRLPKVAEGAPLERGKIGPEQHFTEPPPRYSEATLVKRLEELGIGRPSTYASILTVLQERSYVRLDKRRFVPEDKGRLVTAFLLNYFPRYLEYSFTADMESQLDEISAGDIDWTAVLTTFWRDFSAAVDDTKELRVRDVFDAVNDLLAPYLYGDDEHARTCPKCAEGQLSLKGGKFGFFVGCSRYPECRFTRPLTGGEGDEADGLLADGPQILGTDPETGLDVSLRKGPYGLYLQLGEQGEDKVKPKRASLPQDVPPDQLEMTLALGLLRLPRRVGDHPETGKQINAGIGRYGPFLECDKKYAKLTSTEEVLTIGLNRAIAVMSEAKPGRAAAKALKELGEHPEDGGPIRVMDGRYGPYVKFGRINATLPKGMEPDEVTMEEALVLIAKKAAKGGGKGRGGAKAKTAAKKAPAKKAAAKKPAAKKTAASKSKAKAKTSKAAKPAAPDA